MLYDVPNGKAIVCKVCICSSDVTCFLVCGCVQHVSCKVFTLSGVPTQMHDMCICEPNKLPLAEFKEQDIQNGHHRLMLCAAVQIVLTGCVSSNAVTVAAVCRPATIY